MKSKKAIILLVTVTFLLIGSAPMEALTVLCYSCVRPAGQSLCNYQGRIGTWGDDTIVDGVVFHVCNIPSIVPRAIQPGHAFTGERQAQLFLQMFTVALAGLHYPQ